MKTFVRKLPRKLAWILAAALVVLLGAWIVQGSLSFQSCAAGETQQLDDAGFVKSAATETAAPSAVDCLGDFMDANEPSIVALATIVVAGFAGTLWAATKKMQQSSEQLARMAEDTAQRQSRAYVSGAAEFIFPFDDFHPPRVQLRIHNSGATPANEVRHRIAIVALPGDGAPITPTDDVFSAPFVLFPNAEWRGTIEKKATFDQMSIAALRNGSSRLYCYGDIDYLDVFMHPHRTRFCHEVCADKEVLLRLTSLESPADFKVEFRIAPAGNLAS